MIKRYDIDIGTFGYHGYELLQNEEKHGEWVRYDDIKHLIPDNRVTEAEYKILYEKLIKNAFVRQEVLKDVIRDLFYSQGWIKQEGETLVFLKRI